MAQATEHVHCPLCGADDYRLLSIQKEFYGVAKCRVCGLVYLNPRPAQESIADIYDEDYYNNPTTVGYADYLKTFHDYRDVFEQIFNERLEAVSRLKGCGRILEVGCAHGLLLDHFRKHGWDTYGVELSPPSARYAKEELGLYVQNLPLEEADYPDDHFDVILMLDVIEHFPDHKTALSVIRRVLKPDGFIVVQVPWELYHWEKILCAISNGKKPGTIEPDAVPAHLCFFVPRTLRLMLEKHGFTVFERGSGNYGRIRERIFPHSTADRNLIRRLLKVIYYRLGVRKLLRYIAPRLKQGSGIILYARKRG
ncbi:MAG: class I SAM-dependent methyltransferase [Candidatus Coatesbacteria bacterium]|nr:class I SAM-dependent methyltransferase [Candidatus Coatesbacteria bacterium]